MPPSITLKPLSESARVNVQLPPNPSNPPSTTDIVRSVTLKNEMIFLLGRGQATKDDVMACIDYEGALLGTREGAAPPWFEPAMERILAPMKNDIDTLKGDVSTLKGDVSTLKGDMKAVKSDMKDFSTTLNKTLRVAALTFNGTQATGEDVRLEAVPNEHGTDLPTALPPLSSRKAIRELTPQQQKEWLQYYHPRQRGIGSHPQAQNIADLISLVGALKDRAL